MEELIEALKTHTEAMDRLTASIGLLVQAMVGEEEEMESTTYLDGSVIK